VVSEVASNFDEFDAARIIAIDVPIGFGPRGADAAARTYLRGTASVVRIELPRRQGIELTRLTEAASAPLDDVLDAATAAWSAGRILAGVAKSLPDPPELIDGYPVAIWY
jgi:predicted RNase H-like nuclease